MVLNKIFFFEPVVLFTRMILDFAAIVSCEWLKYSYVEQL
jgi:hypothetical protein